MWGFVLQAYTLVDWQASKLEDFALHHYSLVPRPLC